MGDMLKLDFLPVGRGRELLQAFDFDFVHFL
jgi:hypothetical protein